MIDARILVRSDAPIGNISPRLYGHFAEHLGRCCYGGLWVGDQHTSTAEQGFRRDVVAALKALPVPLLRWPGGCYADHYHWRDGIGPAHERPVRLGMSCGLQVPDDNSLGTHEFLWLCAQLDAEPYLAGNVGSGTPQELCDWVEYCNTAVPTTLGRLRTANGAAQPFGVKLWGVGNENWGCGGNYDATSYGREYIRYATMLRHVDPHAELVICGNDDAWNTELLAKLGSHHKLVDHLSIHHYWVNGGPEVDFTDQEYAALFAEADWTEQFVLRTAAIIADATGGRHRIGIALDEWGVWHPEAREWGPMPAQVTPRQPVTYEQANTLRDALAVGVVLEGFHRQCNLLSMANLAQIVNVLQSPIMTDGDRMWLTPTYHALRLHAAHIGAQALPLVIEEGNAISGTASRNAAGMAFTIINRDRSQPAQIRIRAEDLPRTITAQILSADQPQDGNDLAAPDRVSLKPLSVNHDHQGSLVVELPAHSMATILARS
jgi:alpha-N-arabinofuranosidase